MRLTLSFLIALAPCLSIPSQPGESPPPRGETSLYRFLIAPDIQNSIVLSVVEIAFGSASKAAAWAASAATPEMVRVALSVEGIEAKRAEQLVEWGKQAIGLWNEITPGAPFQIVDGSQNPNVTVSFKDYVRVAGRLVAGHIAWERSVKIRRGMAVSNVSAEIDIANRMPTGRLMSEDQIIKTVCHELGHLLGLEHRPSSSEVMGPVGSNRAIPGEAERAALEELQNRTLVIRASALEQRSASYIPREFIFAPAR